MGIIKIENLDHLGIIAGIIDEIGIVEIINNEIGIDSRENITAGQIVKAIILNGLGFVSRPLYLFPQFFADKATEHLLGKGIEEKHLNDDKIGRVMDKVYSKGVSNLFLLIAIAALKKYGISTNFSHLDATSIAVHGKYEFKDSGEEIRKSIKEEEEETENLPIKITHGYSRDHRHDLKQFIMDLIVSGDGDIPLFLRVADGNENDKKVFGQIVKDYKSRVSFETIIVSDSALYSGKNLKLMQGIEWLCRVPLSIKEAKNLVNNLSKDEFTESEISGYSLREELSQYAGIKQRWLVVESQLRKVSDLEKLEKKIESEEVSVYKKLNQLNRKNFENIEEALEVARSISKKLKYHCLTDIEVSNNPVKKGKKKDKSESLTYKVQANLEREEAVIKLEKNRAGRFVLATNILDKNKLTSNTLLKKYKEQQAAERGFAFLKDPLFFADSIFLKNPQRIETMAMLMGLCLLVYSIGQRQLRIELSQTKKRIKNQLNKLTARPTLRWIFQCFFIHLVLINGIQQIVNLTDERQFILSFFPKACHKYYILSG